MKKSKALIMATLVLFSMSCSSLVPLLPNEASERQTSFSGSFCEIPKKASGMQKYFAMGCEATGWCNAVNVPLSVEHPAEIDIRKYERVAFTNIKGNYGEAFKAAMQERMLQSGALRIVDRSQMDAIMEELNLTEGDLFDSANRVKLGKLMPATVIAMGTIDKDYKEDIGNTIGTCPKFQSSKIAEQCDKRIRTGFARIQGEIQFAQLETGQQIQVKHLTGSAKEETHSSIGAPPPINEEALLGTALTDMTDKVVKAILPWWEKRHVVFYKDSDLPVLERGILEAKAGQIEDAKKIFQKVIFDNESNPEISKKSLASAYFNLGVTYAYTWDFEQADKTFKKVDDIAINEFPAVAMRQVVKCLAEDRDKRNQQEVKSETM